MAVFNKVNAFVEHLAEGVHNLASNTLRIMLVNSPAPVNTNTVRADLTEISAGNGYSAGGVAMTVSSSSQTSGTYRLILADNSITASGGSIGPFRYAVLYNDTPTSPADPLLAWFDYGSSITLADGETLSLDCDPTNGVLSIA
jgi:hypothetical protein